MIFLWILIGLAGIVFLAGTAIFLIVYARFIHISEKRENPEVRALRRDYREQIDEALAVTGAYETKNISIFTRRNVRLNADYIPVEGKKRGVAILVHGFRAKSGRHDMCCAIRWFHENGFDVLVPDLRGHGRSGGLFMGFAAGDYSDIHHWAWYASEHFDQNNIVLDGISMGAATVLMSLGTVLPEGVRCAIADCGFTSGWDELCYLMRKNYHIPPIYPVLWVTSFWAKLVCGRGLKGGDTRKALRQTKIPVFFAHGTADGFVPTFMSEENYGVCASPKELFLAEGAAHGAAFLKCYEEYTRRLSAFLAEHLRSAS